MAKFRTNYGKSSNKASAGKFIRIVLILGLILVFILLRFLKDDKESSELTNTEPALYNIDYFPIGVEGELINHVHFTINYNESHEQANWVAYELTAEQLKKKKVKRSRYFYADSLVSTKSSEWFDYKNSNFTRGHLVPAADRAWDKKIMQSTFLMSNVSPQLEGFNSGIWKEAEEIVREWALSLGHIFVVSGPVFKDCEFKKIGQKNEISVPCGFFKAILYLNEVNQGESIGFLFPHENIQGSLSDFIIPIDSLENYLKWDFFSEMSVDEQENEGRVKDEFWRDLNL